MCTARGEDYDSFAPGDAAQEFQPQPRRAVQGGQLARDGGVERVAVVCRELSPLNGEVDVDAGGVAVAVRRRECVLLCHVNAPCPFEASVSCSSYAAHRTSTGLGPKLFQGL